MKHFLDLGQLEADEIIGLIELAERLKFERSNGIAHPHLRGQTLGVLRPGDDPVTLSALCTGMHELGGRAADIPPDGGGADRSLTETVRLLSGLFSGLAVGVGERSAAEKAASVSKVPLVNCVKGAPASVFTLSALMTLKEKHGSLIGLKLAYIDSDASGADPLIYAAISCGMTVSAAAPAGYRPGSGVVGMGLHRRKLEITSDPAKAAYGASAICTGIRLPGVETSEPQKEYRIGEQTLAGAKEDCAVFHGDPLYRGSELSGAVYQAHLPNIEAEVANRLHVVKALLTKTLKK